jgi:hypothetical protein
MFVHPKIVAFLQSDHWRQIEGKSEDGRFTLRFRTPVLGPPVTTGFFDVLIIVWDFAHKENGKLPTPDLTEEMDEFESRFCEAVEHDATALLTAVLTAEGSRQWVFYTSDPKVCGERLQTLPQKEDPYPIELTTEEDLEWSYLRENILMHVPKKEWK